MIIGFDADQDCSHVATLAVSRGAAFVARYLKNLSAAEAQALSDAGLKIVSIFESGAKEALTGAPGGLRDGAKALQQAQALGQPAGSCIMATADFDEQSSQDGASLAYLRAFKSQIGAYTLGVYGNGALCYACLDQGIAAYTWLAGGSGMRGTKAFAASGKATIVQDVGDKRDLNLGISIDSDVAQSKEYGGWLLGAPPAVSIPAPPSRGVNPHSDGSDDIAKTIDLLQVQLQRAGFYKGAIDGLFGPQTYSAVLAWQKA